ncbi:MAG TPA: IS1380 family transposase [Candidatus Dormibacteraeota bacterium]|nr:IS1380 family transposase [Candidatus Dormibacteraeota bacterium]
MDEDSTRQTVLFSDLCSRPVVASFDQEHGSSDGGAILLQACDRRLGLTERLIECIDDRRQAGKVRHAIGELLRQRLYAIACGYPDGNDASGLGSDPIHKLLCDRDPARGEDLASQPTLSRFENSFDRADLYRMGVALGESVIERHRRRLGRKVRRITIDLDPTDDPTHGAQQLAFFNGHYDTWCYLPVAGFLTFDNEAEQHLFAYALRPGNVTAPVGAVGILSRLLPRLRAAFPCARLRVRLDGGFASAAMFAFLERENLEYVVAMAKNKVLQRRAARLMGTARRLSRQTGETAHVYGECRYAAGPWPHRRRVIIKAEVVRHPGRDPKNNPRFVVTNLKASPRHLYEAIYCARGDIENRIKELHHGLEIDRTSCSRFLANQLRALLTAAAYVLYQELRLRAARTAFRRAQVSTLREQLLKLGAWVQSSARRIVLHLPTSFPHLHDWQIIARALGAAPA